MKRIYLAVAAAAAACAMSGTAFAADVNLCAGRAGGGYDGMMRAIGAELTNKGHNVTVTNLGGSEDILNALADGKCDYGPAQGDVYYLMTTRNPGITASAVPQDVLYNEAMTLVCSAKSGYDELEDIEKGDQIIVDVIGSGSALTWETMVMIEKEHGRSNAWSQAIPVYTPLDEAGAALALGQAKCAFGVGRAPIGWAQDIEKRGGVVSEVYDGDLNDLEFNGGPLYEPVDMPRGAYKTTWDTYKVPAILFRGGKPKDPEVERLVKRLAPALGMKINTLP